MSATRAALRHRHRRPGVQRAGRRADLRAQRARSFAARRARRADRRRVAGLAHCRAISRSSRSAAHPQLVAVAQRDATWASPARPTAGCSCRARTSILLNSDTIVTAGWLDAIMHCAATDPRIGTITPFSNNAEICSFPRFCEDNPWPEGADPEPMRAALAAVAVPTYPDLPTGVGFCMYIRRALLDDVGVFDLAFGAGYGEENDLCVRAARAGWRNVLADNAFVVHTGGRSFAGQKERARAGATSSFWSSAIRTISTWSAPTSRPIRLRPLRDAAADAACRGCRTRPRRPARDPSSWRRHRDARPRADRRLRASAGGTISPSPSATAGRSRSIAPTATS